MSLKDFSTLCKYSFGQSNRTANYNGIVATSRYYASGGGLYPVQVYIYANNVSGVKKGIYRYQLNTHSYSLVFIFFLDWDKIFSNSIDKSLWILVYSKILIAFINSPNSNTLIKHYLNLFLTCMKEHSVFISFLFTIKETTV